MLGSRNLAVAPYHASSEHPSMPVLHPAQAPAVSFPVPWSAAPAPAIATAHAAAVTRDRPAHADARAAHGSDAPALPAPSTPFGPPGRGVVGSASGTSAAGATAGVTCALLMGFVLLLATPPLRRHRMLAVMALPAGFTPLQQRPG
jgi:hypothetical protein